MKATIAIESRTGGGQDTRSILTDDDKELIVLALKNSQRYHAGRLRSLSESQRRIDAGTIPEKLIIPGHIEKQTEYHTARQKAIDDILELLI